MAVLRALLLVVACALVPPADGAAPTAVTKASAVFRAGKYLKPASLSTVTIRDLTFANRLDNVDGLLDLATAENRIDPVTAMQIRGRYLTIADGDVLLLTCLRHLACQPQPFLDIAQTSRLHAEVVRHAPYLSAVQVDRTVGSMTERLMDRYFVDSGWEKLNGQIGQTGIDGLYVKSKGGVIREVLIAESKYNTSPLGNTNFGMQMSDEWIRRKLVELKTAYPAEESYRQVEGFVEKGVYRAALWNLRVSEDGLAVSLSKVRNKSGTVDLVPAGGTDVADLAEPLTNEIRFAEPRNRFQKSILEAYREELEAIGSSEF